MVEHVSAVRATRDMPQDDLFESGGDGICVLRTAPAVEEEAFTRVDRQEYIVLSRTSIYSQSILLL